MKILLVFILFFSFTAGAVNYSFGPNPRAVNNQSIFVSTDANWANLKNDGVYEIVLTSANIMEENIILAPTGTDEATGFKIYPERPLLTFMRDEHLTEFSIIQATNAFRFAYESGTGMSSDACHILDPTQRGVRAAQKEYNKVLKRVLDLGVKIHAIHGDGIFLRLIDGSRKAYSCEEYNGTGFNAADTARAAIVYFKTLRNLINGHVTQAGLQVEVKILVNIINWRVQDLMEYINLDQSGNIVSQTMSLQDVVTAFKAELLADAPSTSPLVISGIVIDYPYNLFNDSVQRKFYSGSCPIGVTCQNTSICGNGVYCSLVHPPHAMRDKVKHLYNLTRNLPTSTNQNPKFSFITNTSLSNAIHSCVSSGGFTGNPFFLPFRKVTGCPVGAASCIPSPTCLGSQLTLEEPYFVESKNYADYINTGTFFQGKPGLSSIESVIFQSWHENPSNNFTYMQRVRGYLLNL